MRESVESIELNEELKQQLIEQATSKVVDLKTSQIDPFRSRSMYIMTGLVTFGLEKLEDMPINQGASTAKERKDILIEDDAGQIFTSGKWRTRNDEKNLSF